MKKYFISFLYLFMSFFCFAQEKFNLSKISELEDYTIMGIVDLREEKGFSSEVKFETLNHEGGMKVRVLEIAEKETFENCEGVWVKVLLTSPMWVSNKEWIEKYNKFWIFLTENTLIYSLERQVFTGLPRRFALAMTERNRDTSLRAERGSPVYEQTTFCFEITNAPENVGKFYTLISNFLPVGWYWQQRTPAAFIRRFEASTEGVPSYLFSA